MERVMITGGRGLLGTQLIPRLLGAGYEVRSASRTIPAEGGLRVEWMRADLATGEGLREAVTGVDIVIHAASAGLGDSYAADVEGTRRLLELADGVKHLLYISIVGVDQIDFDYYRHKLAAEELIEQSNVPYTILRASQFHDLIDIILDQLLKYPVGVLDPGFTLQPVAIDDVADRMVEIVKAGPQGRVPDIAGPEVRRTRDLLHPWLAARKIKRLVIPVRFPGGIWAGWRAGLTTTPGRTDGTITWEQWLAGKYGQSIEDATASKRIQESRLA